MLTISALFIVSFVTLVSSQYYTDLGFNELIPNFQSRLYYHHDNNIFPPSPCPGLFQYKNLNNEIQGLLTVQSEVQSKVHMNFTLSVAVELFSVSFEIMSVTH